jgi:hypothetical protein
MTQPDFVNDGERVLSRTMRNLIGALVGGVLIATVEYAATRASVDYSVADQLGWLARLAVHWGLAALPLGLAFDLTERRAPGGRPSQLGRAIAVLAGAGAGALVMALHGKYLDPAISQTAIGVDLTLPDRFLYGFSQLAFWGAVGAVLHAADERRRRSGIALHTEQVARLRGETQLADARLAALHAQVEPQFLLATLGRVERSYETDAAAADRVLAALICFLREAVPMLRRQHSTLAEECRLLQAYLDVTGTGEARVADVEAATGAEPMPPGLLVSLAQKMLELGPDRDPRFELSAIRAGATITVELSAIAAPATDDAALQETAALAGRRLATTHGTGGSIEVLRSRPGRNTLRITWTEPRED